MPSFTVKFHKISPLTATEVDAETREEAIAQVMQTAGEGEEIRISEVAVEDLGSGPPAAKPKAEKAAEESPAEKPKAHHSRK